MAGPTLGHFELYRLMWAKSYPGKGGDRICPYGQAKLAARLGVTARTIQRLIADMREPGADVRHPDVKPTGLRLGWLEVLAREQPGRNNGRLYGGNRYVLKVDPVELAELEAQANGQTPSSSRSDTPDGPVSAGRHGATRPGVSLSRYVRFPGTTQGGAVAGGGAGGPGGEGEPNGWPAVGSELEQRPRTNNGKRAWIPAAEYVPMRARQIAAGPDGLAGAEAYLAACRRREERQERMRAAGRAAVEREARDALEPPPRPPIDPAKLTSEQRRAMAALEALPDFPDELRIVSKVAAKVRVADADPEAGP